MTNVEIRRQSRPEPEPLPTRAADGSGWLITCPTCGKSRTVTREQVLTGRWLECPHCGGTSDAN